MNALHCDGCGRRIGYAPWSEARLVWCTDPMCRQQPPIQKNEFRDDAAFLLSKLGRHPREVGVLLGVSRQRAIQIIDSRS